MDKDTLIFTAVQGPLYERLAANLFRSIKAFHANSVTACLSKTAPKFCDIHIPFAGDINEFCIDSVPYSFKLGLLPKLKDELKNFKKLIYIDSDSECVDTMHFDESIYNSDFYSAWCQSIVTENNDIQSKINPDWNWLGLSFQNLADFAAAHRLKEWKNVNGGLIVISCDKVDVIREKFHAWVDKIKSFYGEPKGQDELVLSLLQAELNPSYATPNIAKNGICQLNTQHDPRTIRQTKSFTYEPWFNTSGSTRVKATCVHSFGWKKILADSAPEM